MAAKDTFRTIVINENPRGRFLNGYIDGTPKPGTIMQVKAATEPVSGRHTWEVFNRDADGNRPQGPIAILCEDNIQGRTVDDAYVTGTQGLLYIPLPGDELLGLVADIGGTADSHAIGDLLIVDDGTGLLLATTTTETEPFCVMETVGALAVDTLVHVMFTGY
jgi:hypothetical protein